MKELTTIESFGEEKIVKEIVKLADKIKENSAEIAIMCSVLYEKNPSKETTDMLIEKTGFSKSTITQLKEAGIFYRKHVDMLNIETTKAYLIASIEKKDDEVDISELKDKNVRELREFNRLYNDVKKEDAEDAELPEKIAITMPSELNVTELFNFIREKIFDAIADETDEDECMQFVIISDIIEKMREMGVQIC